MGAGRAFGSASILYSKRGKLTAPSESEFLIESSDIVGASAVPGDGKGIIEWQLARKECSSYALGRVARWCDGICAKETARNCGFWKTSVYLRAWRGLVWSVLLELVLELVREDARKGFWGKEQS